MSLVSRQSNLRRYERKAHRDEVEIGVVMIDSESCLPHGQDKFDPCAGLSDAGRRFGFKVRGFPSLGSVPASSRPMSHLIVLTETVFDDNLVAEVNQRLSEWDSASIAFAYPNYEAMMSVEPVIELWKKRAGPRLNFLFPDHQVGGVWRVSPAKILDNAVCDTVRVKYIPERRARRVALPADVLAYFKSASRLIGEEALYLRSSTDGYIAMRGEDGFYITATFTDKVEFDPERIVLVHGYDRADNTIAYSGAYLPSSDAVEAAIMFESIGGIQSILHTHASHLFTRNPRYADRVLVPQLSYGEPALGEALVAALTRVDDGFVIMEQHGEVFAGMDSPSSLIDSVRERCREARNAQPAI